MPTDITAPQNQAFVSNSSPLDKPIKLTSDPQNITDRKIIQKIKFEAIMSPYANAGVLENSWFMRKFGSRLVFENGFNASFLDGVRKGQTVAVTLPIENTGSFGSSDCDDCEDITFNKHSYEVLYLKGGCTWTYGLEDCPPCPGNNCGTDAYDLMTVLNNTLIANRAFAKAFDYALFTGKDIRTGQSISNFASIFSGAKVSTTLGDNLVSDIEGTLVQIKNEINALMYTTFNNAGAGLNYLKARNLRQDLVIFVTAETVWKIRQHYNTMRGSNFQMYEQSSVVGNIANSPLSAIGIWDSTFEVVEIPEDLMPTGSAVAIGDFGSLIGKIICTREKYSQGTGKDMFREYYAKRWTYLINDFSDKFGKYSYTIPKRTTQTYDVAIKTVSSTGTSAANPTFTKAVTS